MFELWADAERNVVCFVCEATVTTTDLAGHRRAAILAARSLDSPFVVATDLSRCDEISTTVANELVETIDQLTAFGLGSELRLRSETTPDRVLAAFERPTKEFPVDVVTIGDTLGSALDAHLETARC